MDHSNSSPTVTDHLAFEKIFLRDDVWMERIIKWVKIPIPADKVANWRKLVLRIIIDWLWMDNKILYISIIDSGNCFFPILLSIF